ncbi:MAG: DUF72 domain-containing protein [Trueperaceae bacterium]
MARAHIGTSGWSYKGWKEDFLGGVPKSEWLSYCAERFTGIEVNGTFYRLQARDTYRKWRDETPREFRFAIKGHRYVTHNKKLGEVDDSIALVKERAEAMGEKLAVVLWQLPANFGKKMEKLERFLSGLESWQEVRHSIEFRDRSWFDEEVAERLSGGKVAVCQSDAPDFPLWDEVTTDLVYVRLHGHTRKYASKYGGRLLDEWAEKTRDWLEEGRDVHVYFDNDAEGHAPWDALRLLERVGFKR